MEMLQKLVTSTNQSTIANATGLAPTHSTAESPDRQATNARLWAAASDRPAPGLQDLFTKPEAKTAFFSDMRDYLKMH